MTSILLKIAECRRMRDEGLSYRAIGQKFGIDSRTVSRLLDPGKWEAKKNADRERYRSKSGKSAAIWQAKDNERRHEATMHEPKIPMPRAGWKAINGVSHFQPRHAARRVIAGEPDQLTMTAAQAFAAGKIDRAELVFALRIGRLPERVDDNG